MLKLLNSFRARHLEVPLNDPSEDGGDPVIAATVVGTIAGLFPGSRIGASHDKLYAARTRQAALETRPSRAPSRWHNPDTGNAGAITPARTYRSASGIYCREYQLTVTAGGRTGQAHDSTWRQPDGAWRVPG